MGAVERCWPLPDGRFRARVKLASSEMIILVCIRSRRVAGSPIWVEPGDNPDSLVWAVREDGPNVVRFPAEARAFAAPRR